MTHDLVIRGGTIADGLGGPLFEADVAVDGGRIAALGKISETGTEEIDARGLLVTPGFVDIHSHYDGQAIWDERLLAASWHGVTTTVMGNCGVGFAPVHDRDRDTLVELMEGVEDIPGMVLRKGLTWDWDSFPDFLDALERRRHDIDVAAYLPHSAMRVFVMGERAVRREPATAEDIAKMRAITADAARAGAMGFSTSRSFNHRTTSGDYIPSLGAEEEELVGIAQGLTDAGRGVLQIILTMQPENFEKELSLIRHMVKASGRPLSVTVLQRLRHPENCRRMMAAIAECNAEGLRIVAQTTPRPLGTLFGLDLGERHPFCFHPSYAAIAHEPLESRVATMRDPAFRAKLLAEKPEGDPRLIERVSMFDYMFELGDPPNYAPGRADSIEARAAAEGRTPLDLVYDVMLKNDGRSMLFAPNSGLANYNLDGVRELIEDPNSVVAVSDGGAHVSHISDVSFPTFMLTYWGRDRPEGALDLGWVVKRMSRDTADVVGLRDRGTLAPGFKADINVIDHGRLRIGAPYMVHDLPMGAKRLLQKADGYLATIVGGEVVYREGEATGALPGRLVRGAQPDPTPRAAAAE